MFKATRTKRKFDHHMRDVLKEHSITLTEAEVLMSCITNERPSDIAEVMFAERATVSRCLEELEAIGYIERTYCRTDRRVVIVKLTNAGKAVCKALNKQADKFIGEAL